MPSRLNIVLAENFNTCTRTRNYLLAVHRIVRGTRALVTQISCFVPITFQTQLELTGTVAVATSVKQVRRRVCQTDVYMVSVVPRFSVDVAMATTTRALVQTHTHTHMQLHTNCVPHGITAAKVKQRAYAATN